MRRSFQLRSYQVTLILMLGLTFLPQRWVEAKSKEVQKTESNAVLRKTEAVTTRGTDAAINSLEPTSSPLVQEQMTLKDMGATLPLLLRGVDGDANVSMSVRLDEVVETAQMHLVYTASPALIAGLSHLKIMLNGEVLQTVALDKDKLGSQQSADIDVDTRYFADYNRFRFQLIGHYTMDCENPNHSSLWASISNESYVNFGLRRLPLRNDLALLPAPFFDERDNRQINLPIVFGSNPSSGLLKASGSIATWIGMLGAYRGARFDVLENTLPERHAIVLATNCYVPRNLRLKPPQYSTSFKGELSNKAQNIAG